MERIGMRRFAVTTATAATLMLSACVGPAEVARSQVAPQPQSVRLAPRIDGPVYQVTPLRFGYRAQLVGGKRSFRGPLKGVLQRTVAALQREGGGTVRFTAGTFDFGDKFFAGKGIRNIAFVGAGMRKTRVKNESNKDEDTEPFNFFSADRVVVRDLTVVAGGVPRTTSDALDFDRGNNVVVLRVRVLGSRGRGIVFDGKDTAAASANNRVRGCVIRNVTSHGIELLASNRNVVEKCRIFNPGGTGILIRKSSPTSAQPNKPSSDNVIRNNRINQAGEHGISIIAGHDNRVVGNRVLNSGDEVADHDGIRVDSEDGLRCDRTLLKNNLSTDRQKQKTQRFGINIASPMCHDTKLENNDVAGNLRAGLNDLGTNTSQG